MAYADDINIDLNDLEGEWKKHPNIMHHYLVQLVEAQRQRAEIVASVEKLQATLSSDARGELEINSKKTVTETQVKQVVLQNDDYNDLQTMLRDVDYQIGLLKAARDKMEHRRDALVNLVKLKLSDWYAEPREEPRKSKESQGRDEKRAAREDERESLGAETMRKNVGKFKKVGE